MVSKLKAFTFTEVLVCIGILVAVAAITYPVFSSVKTKSRIVAAKSNLHQLHLAIALYRNDNGSGTLYGEPAEMGLPVANSAWPSPYSSFGERHRKLLYSPCGLNLSWYQPEPWENDTGPLENIIYRPADAASYVSHVRRYEQDSLLFIDVNCDDPEAPINNEFFRHRGLAVLLEGRLIERYKPGLMLGNDHWWMTGD